MKSVAKIPAILTILFVLSMVSAACSPAVAPSATPTKAPAAASPTEASKTEVQKPEATKPVATSPAAPAKTLAPYKIGLVISLSGYFTAIGIPTRDAAVALANEINAGGGINGRRLELVVFDDGSDETKAVLAYKKVINDDKVLAIVGPASTGFASAVAPVAEESQVPAFVVAGGTELFKPVRKFIFSFVPSEATMIPEMYRYLKSKGIKKLATLNPMTGTGKMATAYIKETAAKEGFEVVAQESFEPNDKEFTPQLTKIKAAGANGLLVYDGSVASALIAKQMKSMNINIPWVGPYGLLNDAVIKAAGDAFDGLVAATPKFYVPEQLSDDDPQKKLALQYNAVYKKSTGKEADPMGVSGWDPVLAIAEALKRSNPDPDKLAEAQAKLRDAIEGLKNFATVTAVISMSPTDHQGFPPNWMVSVELQGGKFKLLK